MREAGAFLRVLHEYLCECLVSMLRGLNAKEPAYMIYQPCLLMLKYISKKHACAHVHVHASAWTRACMYSSVGEPGSGRMPRVRFCEHPRERVHARWHVSMSWDGL